MRSEIYDIAIRAGFADRASDVAVALTELVANAQQHGDPPFLVEAWWDGRLIIEVSNRGTGVDGDSLWRSEPPRTDEVRGRGLWLVRHLVDLVDVRTGAERTMVRVELSPEPHIGA
jgi:anti-sigma regulatory factor (Ser/Thr protein kinase)